MPAPLRVILTEAEEQTLSDLRIAGCVPCRVRDRAHIVLLNARGWNAPAIADIFNCHEHTVRTTIKRWQTEGLGGLWEADGRGRKPTWEADDLAYLEQCLDTDERTYNSVQLAAKLEQERNVKLGPTQVRRLLKKRSLPGSAPARVI
ncbi:MAG: helix-turn-helix domain-containing protein [Cyanobacteria bacterium J06636_28]